MIAQKRADVMSDARRIADTASAEKRNLSPDEQGRFDLDETA
jgi:hypothetical protein